MNDRIASRLAGTGTPTLLTALLSEIWCWVEAALRWLPGRLGRGVRALAYRPFMPHVEGQLSVADYAHIWQPWKLHVTGPVRIGRYNQVNCTGEVHIGPNTIIGPFVLISSTNHRFEDPEVPIRDQGLEPATTTIRGNTWIGAHAVITAGVTIGTGVVVAAGAVVTKDVPDDVVVGGVPARVLRPRAGTEPTL